MKFKKLFLIIFSLCISLSLACGFAACGGEEDTGIPVASVGFNKNVLELEVGETYKLNATVLPSNATDKTLIWSSSDSDVASVSDGLITAKKEGEAEITAKSGNKQAVCTVTVTPETAVTVPVTSVTLNQSVYTLAIGASYTLIPTVLPANATDRQVKWSSSNEKTVTVSDRGVIQAIAEGTSTIKAEAGGKSATCAVTVEKTIVAVTEVTLDRTSLSLKVNETFTLSATVAPENATDKAVKWTTSNSGVVRVSNGTVTAVGEGTAKITAAAGGKSASCTVTVEKEETEIIPVESVTLNRNSLELGLNEAFTLSATVTPENATDKAVKWTTSDSDVVRVSNGTVTAVGEGTAKITAAAGGKSASCTVIVKNAEPEFIPVESVTLNRESLELKVDETFTLTALIAPSDATETEITWNSDNTSVATVADGIVTAVGVGTANITATAGGVTAVCEIGVIAKDEPVIPPDPDVPAEDDVITYAHSGEECAAFEWKDADANKAKVEYKLSSSNSYIPVDKELIRQISADTARVDILGLKGGAKYDFRITTGGGKIKIITGVEISSHDRSGYAHYNYTGGVGAYNDDGTLKSDATVIYVTEENKNNVDGSGKSIAEYLASARGNKKPIVVRIIGTVGAATWKEGNVTYTKTSGNTDSEGNLLPEAIVGANGKALDQKNWTQAELVAGGYNVLDTSRFAELRGLSSTVKWDSSKQEFDSCWNDCQIREVKNITVEGVGEDAEIFQWGMTFKNCNSVEVRNIRFYDYTEDACSIEGSENSTTLSGFKHKNFWIHHNTFDIGVNYWDVCKEQDKHDGDGSTDFKYLSHITVSYNRYNGTHKTGLVGGSDSARQACFTFHHNYYNGCDQRMPLGRQANMHMYNNYYAGSGLYSISLRAGAYAFIENCVFTSGKSTTRPIELVKGSYGVPSAKVINCDIDEKKISNAISGVKNLYVGSDRTAVVEGGNLYGLNFEQDKDFYTVSDMLATSEVKKVIPEVAGVMHRNSNIDLGGTVDPEPPVPDPDPEPDPPVEPTAKTVTMNVAEAVNENILAVNTTAHNIDNVTLAEGIVLNTTGNKTKVTEHNNEIEGKLFTHRVVLKGKGNYFKLSVTGACTVRVYVANGSSTDTKSRNIGIYKDAEATTLAEGTALTGLVNGEKQLITYDISASGDYFLESIDNELSIYQIEIIYAE